MNNNLAEVLRQRRRAKELTLKQLEELSGVNMTYFGRIEKGKRFPSVSVLRKLAEPLGFTETELFGLAGYLPKESKLQEKGIVELAQCHFCKRWFHPERLGKALLSPRTLLDSTNEVSICQGCSRKLDKGLKEE